MPRVRISRSPIRRPRFADPGAAGGGIPPIGELVLLRFELVPCSARAGRPPFLLRSPARSPPRRAAGSSCCVLPGGRG